MIEFSKDGINFDLKFTANWGPLSKSPDRAIKSYGLKSGDYLWIRDNPQAKAYKVRVGDISK